MVWYLIAIALSIVFASAAQKLKEKKNIEVVGGVFHLRTSYYCFAIMSFLPIFIVAAIRYEVGTDWPIYLDYYHWINEESKGFSEKLFNLMNKIVYRTVNDFQGIIVLVAFCSYFFLFKAIYQQSVSAPLSLIVFFISCMYFASMNQLRQAISMPIMLYAYKYIRDKKPIRYFFWCIVATLFHASSIVYIPLYFIAKFKPTLRRYVSIFGLIIITLPVLQMLLEILINHSKYAWYSYSIYNVGDEANNFYVLGFIFQLILLIIMSYYRFSSDQEDALYDGMLNCYFLSVVMLLFTSVLSQVLRISYCFGYIQILLIPRMIDREKNRTRRIILNGVIPYQTFFVN